MRTLSAEYAAREILTAHLVETIKEEPKRPTGARRDYAKLSCAAIACVVDAVWDRFSLIDDIAKWFLGCAVITFGSAWLIGAKGERFTSLLGDHMHRHPVPVRVSTGVAFECRPKLILKLHPRTARHWQLAPLPVVQLPQDRNGNDSLRFATSIGRAQRDRQSLAVSF